MYLNITSKLKNLLKPCKKSFARFVATTHLTPLLHLFSAIYLKFSITWLRYFLIIIISFYLVGMLYQIIFLSPTPGLHKIQPAKPFIVALEMVSCDLKHYLFKAIHICRIVTWYVMQSVA